MLNLSTPQGFYPVMLDLLGFPAVSICFGKWVDGRTTLVLDLKNFSIQNGLRKVGLGGNREGAGFGFCAQKRCIQVV